jgi:uncharacterized membrane protein
MKYSNSVPPLDSSNRAGRLASAFDKISQNIDTILAYYAQEEEKISRSQRTLEKISSWVGPVYFISILLFVVIWISVNLALPYYGQGQFDAPPFFWLQGIVGLISWLTTTVIVIKQNRLAKLDEQRAHLDLQLNLLTEQKTTKLISLMEELRRDLPIVENRFDSEADALQESTNPSQVLDQLQEHHRTEHIDPRADKTVEIRK